MKMKRKLSFLTLALLLLSLVLSLSACSVYGTIEKNFTAAGYKVVDTTTSEGENALAFLLDTEENGKLSCTVHLLKKELGTYAVILEFGADKDAQAKLSEMLTDADIDNFKQVDDTAKLLRGNCILIPVTLNIFSAEAIVTEMVTLFNK